ncbi:MAG TPA: ABC transporter substrate-binding protein [Solirubrobacteraceae bacterium]|nr:ABC transporter substrate-binding protein [Solirubrobacteraceae bacterium]
MRAVLASLPAALLALLLTACGSQTKRVTTTATVTVTRTTTAATTPPPTMPTVTVLETTGPDSLDPQVGTNSQSDEATWLAYTGLLTYAHADGVGSTRVIPGLAIARPTISDDGMTYTLQLRSGLRYSNGFAVRASDFTYTVERALRLHWAGDSYIAGSIVGASAYAAGHASTISGIQTDNATGSIVIHLRAPYGAFENVLAFPALGLVPAGVAMTPIGNSPPPGVGPYMLTNVTGNAFKAVINPLYAAEAVPGIPVASVDISVRIGGSAQSDISQVLADDADVLDPSVHPSPAAQAQLRGAASSRFAIHAAGSTEFFFLNVRRAPFLNPLAREAVIVALDRPALSALDGGSLIPGCYLIPPAVVGHPTAPCPFADPTAAGDLARARRLMARSGMLGAPVIVSGERSEPMRAQTLAYVHLLGELGFHATAKIFRDGRYAAAITDAAGGLQTGFAVYDDDFPSPIDFYRLLEHSTLPVGNEDLDHADDPFIQSSLRTLAVVPTSKLRTVSMSWRVLDRYVARRGYLAVVGYGEETELTSSRIDFAAVRSIPFYGLDWTSLRLSAPAGVASAS